MKKFIYLISCLLLVGVCSCGEDALTPSEPMGFGEFPQGNASYDREIVEFYDKYGVQVLYRFGETDFRWNITEYIPYYAVEAETSSIGEGWNFLKENCLSIWSDDFLRKYMPYRILLASEIYSLKDTYRYDDEGNKIYQKIPKKAMYGLNHLTFGAVNSRLSSLSVEEKKELIGEVAFAIAGYAASKGKIEVPEKFQTYHDDYINNAGGDYEGEWGYNGGGCLEYRDGGMDYYYDFGLFVKYLVMMSKEEFENRFLTEEFDCGTQYDSVLGNSVKGYPIRNKYEAVIEYFQNTLGIDLHEIGARTSQLH